MFPLNSEQMAQKKGLILWRAVFAGSIVADGLYKLKEISAKNDTCTAITCINVLKRKSLVLKKKSSLNEVNYKVLSMCHSSVKFQ